MFKLLWTRLSAQNSVKSTNANERCDNEQLNTYNINIKYLQHC